MRMIGNVSVDCVGLYKRFMISFRRFWAPCLLHLMCFFNQITNVKCELYEAMVSDDMLLVR